MEQGKNGKALESSAEQRRRCGRSLLLSAGGEQSRRGSYAAGRTAVVRTLVRTESAVSMQVPTESDGYHGDGYRHGSHGLRQFPHTWLPPSVHRNRDLWNPVSAEVSARSGSCRWQAGRQKRCRLTANICTHRARGPTLCRL